jgi:hypothetical protein
MTRVKQTTRKTTDGTKRRMVTGAKGKKISLPRPPNGRIAPGTVDDDGNAIRKTTVFKPATIISRRARRAQQVYIPAFTEHNTAVMSAYLVQQRIPGAPTSLSAGAVWMLRHLIINFVTKFTLAAAEQKHHRAPLSLKYSESDGQSAARNCMPAFW